MLVKICGITRLEDAEAAVDLGAGAVGFILWPDSPRVVAAERAREIVASLPEGVLAVGVFVNQGVDEVNGVAERIGLTHVQLHGDETPEYAAGVERRVIKATSAFDADTVGGWRDDTTWLADARDPVRRGGTGRTADWAAAAQFARSHRVLLAGGLTPENVADAIDTVRPYGIDVSSGVEIAPGIKDHERLKRLFEAIKAGPSTSLRAGRED
jgi:phosphoribosylanthranilate isomerase